jgi:hypothetical protein
MINCHGVLSLSLRVGVRRPAGTRPGKPGRAGRRLGTEQVTRNHIIMPEMITVTGSSTERIMITGKLHRDLLAVTVATVTVTVT